MNNISDLTASISAILKSNNLSELSLDNMDELSDPTYIIWWDNNCTPYEDPVIKVTSNEDGLSFKVDARDFGNTITVQDYDIDRLEWWQGIHANILEVLQRDGTPRCSVCGKPLEANQQFCSDTCRKFTTLPPTIQDEERYQKIKELQVRLQTEQKALLIDLLKHNGEHITLHPVSDEEGDIEYPVTMTFYGKHDNPNISITDVYLNEHGEPYIDGIDEATGSVERGFQVYPEQISWVLDFLAIALDFKKIEITELGCSECIILKSTDMTPQEQVKSLTDKIISSLCRITERPDGWLPHIVYVEEEGDYPIYNRYELIDYAPDGSCTLYNPRTDSRENDFHLSDINIDWLVTIWNRYVELCIEQNIWKDRGTEILWEDTTANKNSTRQLYAYLWSCNYMDRNASDEEIIEAWENGPSRSKTDEEDDKLYVVEKLIPDELAERINDESFAYAEDYVRFIEIEE